MDLQARLAELEAKARELEEVSFGTIEAGDIPADEYFTAREVGGEVGQLAYEEQATRQTATEEDWNRLLTEQLAKKQAEAAARPAIATTRPEADYIAVLARDWRLANPETWEPGQHSVYITRDGSLYEGPPGAYHGAEAGRILDLVREPGETQHHSPFDVQLLGERTGWLQVPSYKSQDPSWGTVLGFEMSQKPTAAQVRAIRRLIDSQPTIHSITVYYYPRGESFSQFQARDLTTYAEVVSFLRGHYLLPETMADIAENLADVGYQADPKEMVGLLNDALASEHQAISMYDNIVGKAGLGDNETRLVAESILVDEKEHAGKLDSLLHHGVPVVAAAPECEEIPFATDSPVGTSGDLAEWVSGIGGSPGIVVDADEAKAHPCIRMVLRPGHELVYAKGIIGPLDDAQKALYCQQGYVERQPTEKQKARMQAMSDAAKLCRVESVAPTTEEHLVRYFSCLGRELKAKGVQL